ncbi:MAG: formate dehydrogenase accessory sulfurtransferase FdhD [Deltaproteobacteria bacterium]|nr:formate dehydrogenase accessory sulfurtransferase FdhD [Deltaproteobacteria bacterium]
MQFADERALSLCVGGQVLTVLMATPGLERELAAGYALTMGWSRPSDSPPRVNFHPGQGQVELDLDVSPAQLGVVRAAGGGLLGPTEADPLAAAGEIELAVLRNLTSELGKAQVIYPLTRGTHAAALFNAQGKMLAHAEDVGRHNGLDKAVGLAWLKGTLSKAAALALSGRCSLEMVLKSVRAGVGVVASVSAPTVPAVEAAERLGLTLVNCSGPEELKIYTHPRRITADGQALPPP